MKVLYYIHSLTVGGAETIVTNYLIALKGHGVDVALVVNNKANTFLEDRINHANIKIYQLNSDAPTKMIKNICWRIKNKFISYRKKFNHIIDLEKPDLLHIHTYVDRIGDIEFPANKIFYSFHTDVRRSLSLSGKRNYRILQEWTNKKLNFFALSEKMKKDIQSCFHTNQVFVLHNGIDLDDVRKKRYDRNNFLSSIGIPNDSFVLGHIGRFHPVKNHERIVDIFKTLHEKQNNSYLLLIGGDVDDRIEKIKGRVSDYGLSEYVRFLGIRDDATSIINCFDAFILPSFTEGFPLVLVESQALKVRSVASDCVPKDICCNNNCFRISLNQSDADWVELLLSDSICKSTRDLELFDIRNIVKLLIMYYCEAMGESIA